MDAALVADQGMDLVDDDGAHGAEHLAGHGAGQDQVEGLGGGDEDVGRALDHAPPDRLRRVAGADQDVETGKRRALLFGQAADTGQGGAKVALDVVVQRFEGRDVEQADAFLGAVVRLTVEAYLAVELIDGPEERCQRLARAGGRQDESVLAALDGRPALGLGRCGLAKGLGEPGLDCRQEGV
jgi:hypothetical protein